MIDLLSVTLDLAPVPDHTASLRSSKKKKNMIVFQSTFSKYYLLRYCGVVAVVQPFNTMSN